MRTLSLTTLLTLALTACATEPASQDAPAFDGSGKVIEGEFVVSTKLNAMELQTLGLEELEWDSSLQAGLYRAEDGVSLSALQRALDMHDATATIEPNRQVFALGANDPFLPYQWNFEMMEAEQAWTLATGRTVTVAVVDTGVWRGGQDTPERMLDGWDFVDNDSDPTDIEGHGTHVAGTIAQATSNAVGVAGLAPDVTILPVRVLGPYGGTSYTIARGITYAVDKGADVINLSLGSHYTSSVEREAIDYALARGVVLVAATGNEGYNSVGYPAAYDGVIAVGAVGADGRVAAYSNGGAGLDVVAPGGDMGRDLNGDGYADGILQETLGGYEFYEGTSMATPHVAAIAALLLEAGADPADVPDLLASTATDVGSSGWDTRAGYGLVDPVLALETVLGDTAPASEPLPEPEPEPEYADTTAPTLAKVGGTRSGNKLTITWTTDEPASSEIYFEGYGRYGDAEALVTEHELRFTINPQDSYEFTLYSVDAAGNEGSDGVWTSSR